jgi:hypothetical protein
VGLLYLAVGLLYLAVGLLYLAVGLLYLAVRLLYLAVGLLYVAVAGGCRPDGGWSGWRARSSAVAAHRKEGCSGHRERPRAPA